ncbi:hypothetical protein EKO04_010307 [Ascochyta lentis]|uniref:Heterokaryon incompatibility domain-containing protein n=1 Tax=Ascochyta lentis TaxID=205686 RepID=A0A8H7ITB2_9PLEO|nr:hypothetical protein EKO04_010307 [Ascochyta lentis]
MNQKRFLPTRLLDLQACGDSLDIRLVETESLKPAFDRDETLFPGYLALSHCWGEDRNLFFTTKKANLEHRLTKISADHLPKTFYDAVNITRSLDHRYLWIDSLCIIQDSNEDWAREAARMADVYGNACCVLSALSSENGTQGCFMTSDIRESTGNSYLDFQVHRETQSYVRLYCKSPATWSAEYGEEAKPGQDAVRNPLRYRAWTLQEAELSRRTIFFADRQLLWRCQELKGTTELPWIEQLADEVFKMKSWPLCDGLQDDQTEGIFSDTRLRWYELVEDYSLRSLTYDSDKLTALAGLAREYQRIFPGAQYVAGMWGPHTPRVPLFRLSDNPRLQQEPRRVLHAGSVAIGAHCSATLLWRSTSKGAHRYPEYIAPTWSWASVKGRISYDSQRIEPHGNSFDRMGVREELSDCDFGGMRWQVMKAKVKNGDCYGAVEQGAYLNLEDALITQCSVPDEPSLEHFKQTKGVDTRTDSIVQMLMESLPAVNDGLDTDGEPLTKEGEIVGVFFRDSADDALSCQGEIFCLRVRGEPFFSVTRHKFKNEQEITGEDLVMGIILVRTWSQGLEKTYKRIGLARWVSASLFQSCQPVNIKLV